MQVSVIIVNYNVKYFLEHCLCSLQKALRSFKSEIFVVDNASSDGSLEYLLDKFPTINFIDNPKNVGFASANNQALKESSGAYILFLNPDTILSEDCIEKCLQLFETNLQVGACGVKMIDGTGKFLPESKRAFPSFQTSFYKLSGLSRLFPHSRLFSKYHLGHLPENQDNEVDVLSGAYFMVRKKVLEKTGGFDERFFMYGEDIDLSYRIQQAGYKNFYLAKTSIIHFKGESTNKGSLDYVRMFYKAMSLFVEKHYKSKSTIAAIFLVETSIWFRAGLSATKNIFSVKETVKQPENINTLIIAGKNENSRIELILKKQAQNRKLFYGQPSEDLKKTVFATKPDEIILSEGALTYKDIISYMQEFPKDILFSIYSSDARTIVGSSSKNSNGYMLA